MAELTKKQQYWKGHLDALASFDGSTIDYARHHDLDPKKLYVFKSVIREREALASSPPAFVKASTSIATVSSVSGGVVVLLPNGVRLNLPVLDAVTLSQLATL